MSAKGPVVEVELQVPSAFSVTLAYLRCRCPARGAFPVPGRSRGRRGRRRPGSPRRRRRCGLGGHLLGVHHAFERRAGAVVLLGEQVEAGGGWSLSRYWSSSRGSPTVGPTTAAGRAGQGGHDTTRSGWSTARRRTFTRPRGCCACWRSAGCRRPRGCASPREGTVGAGGHVHARCRAAPHRRAPGSRLTICGPKMSSPEYEYGVAPSTASRSTG